MAVVLWGGAAAGCAAAPPLRCRCAALRSTIAVSPVLADGFGCPLQNMQPAHLHALQWFVTFSTLHQTAHFSTLVSPGTPLSHGT